MSTHAEYDEPDDYDGCMCGDDDCPECGRDCSNCGGSGRAEDMTFW